MKTITLAQFQELLVQNGWTHEQAIETVNTETREEWRSGSDAENPELISSECVYGVATNTSTYEDISITYTERWSFIKYDEDSFSHGEDNGDGVDNVWTVEGVVVLDEDGEVMTSREFIDEEIPSDFSDIDYCEIEIEQIEDVDVNEDDDQRTHTLTIDNAADIRFTGDCVAGAQSSDNNASGSSYSGNTGRWTELNLYKTDAGRYICHKVECTRWQGESDYSTAEVCDNLEAVIAFFGHDWLAKDLYDNGEITATTDIDYDGSDDMSDDTHTLTIDNKPDLRFTGELIAAASSSDSNASGSRYSGDTGRWTELNLYKTKGGRYICHEIGRTRWQGERDRHKGMVCDTQAEVVSFFGHRWLAKDLYASAGIEDVQVVD